MTEPGGPVPDRKSSLGRLLEELSWVGGTIARYRDGGKGDENTLTFEVMNPLDFLPRTAFLGAVLRGAHGADEARASVAAEAEATEISLFDEWRFGPVKTEVVVQPDGVLESPSTLTLLEAKRIAGPSPFRPEQLTREYLCLLDRAGHRTPLLLLILASPPPVYVQNRGRLPINDAIAAGLDSVLTRTQGHTDERDQLLTRVPEVVAWTTWAEISAQVEAAAKAHNTDDPSTNRSVQHLATSLVLAVARHSTRTARSPK